MPTKGYMLRARITDDDHERLKQLAEAYKVDSLSAAIRILIRTAEVTEPETLVMKLREQIPLSGSDSILEALDRAIDERNQKRDIIEQEQARAKEMGTDEP